MQVTPAHLLAELRRETVQTDFKNIKTGYARASPWDDGAVDRHNLIRVIADVAVTIRPCLDAVLANQIWTCVKLNGLSVCSPDRCSAEVEYVDFRLSVRSLLASRFLGKGQARCKKMNLFEGRWQPMNAFLCSWAVTGRQSAGCAEGLNR